jgi:CRISPR/Cas system-associated endonuclease/helicase Cas3
MSEIKEVDPEFLKKEGMLPAILKELNQYKNNHRLLLVVSCTFSELMVSTLIEAYCRNGKNINKNTRDFPFSVRLTLLYEMKILNEAEFKSLNWLRKKRNDAAHKPDFKFTNQHLPSWVDENHSNPDKLFSLCINIIGVFWNRHVQLFKEKLPVDS